MVQKLLVTPPGHHARYLHVRQERLGQIKSPLGLLNLRAANSLATPHCGPRVSLSVAEVFATFCRAVSWRPRPRAVLRRLSRCHTGQLGWSLWRCEACSAAHWRPLGCGDRHCPGVHGRARELAPAPTRSALAVRLSLGLHPAGGPAPVGLRT